MQENQLKIVLTLNRSGDTSTDATVHYATSDGTAKAGPDYTAKSADVTIPAGSSSTTITIPITNDHTPEPTEEFTVTLTPTASAAIGAQGTATVKIIDKDGPAPTIEFAAATYGAHENAGTVVLTVRRNGRQSTAEKAHYATSDDTAHAPGDYAASSGDVVFEAGGADTQTITIPIVNDRKPEPDKTFRVTLTKQSAAEVGPQQTATVTIIDLD
jgi:hypothetical protein